jgi:nucleoside-diphosphate-sugar epimerase
LLLVDEKILITGPAGQIAFPLARELAKHNDVWGIARFQANGSRERVERAGVKTRILDLAHGDFDDLPDDFTYVLHLAAYLAPDLDYDAALRVNAEGTGLLLTHCRKAKAALVMTTTGVYRAHPDPWRPYVESDPLGDCNVRSIPTYSISKIGQEVAARTCARQFNLPIVIARMNTAYGNNGGYPAFHLDSIIAGKPVEASWNPNPYSPIHEQDIFEQLPALLDAAAVPATVVNWGGDEPASVQQWCGYFGELLGLTPDIDVIEVSGRQRGVIADNKKRMALTGPCRVSWQDGMRNMLRARCPDLTL